MPVGSDMGKRIFGAVDQQDSPEPVTGLPNIWLETAEPKDL